MTSDTQAVAVATPSRAARLAAVHARMAAEDLDHLLVSRPANVRWLTGFTGSAGQAYVTRQGPTAGEVLLITDDRYRLRAAEEAPEATLVIDRTSGWLTEHHPAGQPLAVEADVLTWQQVTDLGEVLGGTQRLLPTTGVVTELRARKDEGEAASLASACAVTVRTFEEALTWLAPGMTERQVAVRLARTMVDLGAEAEAFPAIVASGPNGAIPHHEPGERVLQAGELLTMDFGARVDGYHADMTRTVALGAVDLRLRRLHDLVRQAQQAGVAAVADGVATAAVDRAARSLISDAGHGGDFRHGTGHGVGLEVHEGPYLGSSTPGTLASRMTVTVEPGIYVTGLGGVRIEDVVMVQPTGAQRLTAAPHDLIIL